MKIEDEMLKLPKLKHVGLALVGFVYSLEEGTFVQKTTDWIYEPSHFVAFGFPQGRTEQIRLQFRQPFPHYLEENDKKILRLYAGRFNHYKCLIESPRQLACAAKYIELSFLHPC
jgi:hypothetical protein